MHPVDDPDSPFLVLRDDSGNHSLWPTVVGAAPAGWSVDFGPADRAACLLHVLAASAH